LLSVVEAQEVVTYALVNPVVAMLLGAIFAGERVSGSTISAAVLVLTAVAIIFGSGGPGVKLLCRLLFPCGGNLMI
jgi:drug/metabolite transporter (DMT)-like permease